MKRNRIIVIAIIILIALVTVMLTSCKDKEERNLDTLKSALSLSAEQATTLTGIIEVKDGDTVVYRYTNKAEFSQDKTVLTISEAKLNSSFQLEERSTYDTINNPDRSGFVPLNVEEKSIASYKYEGDNLSMVISNGTLSSLLGTSELSVSEEDATVKITFEGERISDITCNYTTAKGRKVTIVYNYKYQGGAN